MLLVGLICDLSESFNDLPIVVAQLRNPSMDLFSHSVNKVRPGFILAVVVQIELSPVENLQKVLVVYSSVKTGRVLLNNAQDASRLKSILSHLEKSIYEVIFSKNALRIVVETLKLVGEL